MIPNKIEMFMGYNNLALILEQERKHWLLKTDKRKQLQDKVTGEIFEGQIDNLGSDIIVESQQLPIKNNIIQSISYDDPNVKKILNVDYSAFPYAAQVDGLMMARMTSISFPYTNGDTIEYKQYKLRFTNCQIVTIPFGSSSNSADVFAGKWLMTSTAPYLLMLGPDDTYSIQYQINFDESVTNAVFYYPLSETLQPMSIANVSDATYDTNSSFSDNGYIGYPLYWFTCDQSTVLPRITLENNADINGNAILYIGSEGNKSIYNSKLYFGINGMPDPTYPDASTYSIEVKSKVVDIFKNIDLDLDIELANTITIKSSEDTNEYVITIKNSDNYSITMMRSLNWTYVDASTYVLNDLSIFNVNTAESPLLGFLNIHTNESIKPYNESTNIGCAGIRVATSNMGSDIYERYPYSLNEWDGIPEWLNDDTPDDYLVPQHMAIFAIHNTPEYIENDPTSRQVAALLLDPGKMKTDNESNEFANDERGRVYVLSNDEAKYINNSKTEYPKPARTVARICDVPTSVVQLSGISGIAPTSIVDDKYVRTQVGFTESDKARLYNTLHNNWVVPTMLDAEGVALTTYPEQTNDFIFTSIKNLDAVDLKEYNDLRLYENLNPIVDPIKVELDSIMTRGINYKVNDVGVIVVGGFAFNYIVKEVDSLGGVADLVVAADRTTGINISNFNIESEDGTTATYGTSPLTGEGTGLKFKMIITNYASIKPRKGDIRSDLFALVRINTGLWLYRYIINEDSKEDPKEGAWTQSYLISEYEVSDTSIDAGMSEKDVQLNSILPSVRSLPCAVPDIYEEEEALIAFATSSFVNVVDKAHVPFKIITPKTDAEQDLTEVDMCCMYCDGIRNGETSRGLKTAEGVLTLLKVNNELRYDSYVFYKFNDPLDPNNFKFTYGIIHRGFNNYQSTDKTTLLPPNKLKIKSYVHSNESTTIVWDTPIVGPMMWMYNPESHIKESYSIDPDTRELNVDTSEVTWANIKIRVPMGTPAISLVDASTNKLIYNILTNNVIQASDSSKAPESIYEQPDFRQLPDLQSGTNMILIDKAHQPLGNWRLVHPRVESFVFENSTTGRKFTPIKMRMIKGETVNNLTNIIDNNGNVVNTKCMVVNEKSGEAVANIYNRTTGVWDKL